MAAWNRLSEAARGLLASLRFALGVVWPWSRPEPQAPDWLTAIWLRQLQRRASRAWGRGAVYPGMIIGYRRDGRPIRLAAGAAGVTFDALGPSSAGKYVTTGTSTTWAHVNNGNCIIVALTNTSGTSHLGTSVSYGGNALSFLGYQQADGASGNGGVEFWGLISNSLPTGSNTVSAAWSSGVSVLGSMSFANAGSFGTVAKGFANAASASASVAGTTSGNMIAAFASYGGTALTSFTATNSGTMRIQGIGDTSSGADNLAAGTWASAGGAQTVGFSVSGGGDWWGLVAVEIQASGSGPGAVQVPVQQQARRRGRSRRGDSRPAQQQIPDFPPVIPQGVSNLTAIGSLSTGGTISAGTTLSGTGSITGAVGQYITGVVNAGDATGGYFADNTGKPRFVLGDAAWALPGNAGRWNSGNWQADFDTYFGNRASQGFTAIYTKPIGTTQSGNLDNFGKTFDSLYPFQGGSPSTGVSGANPSTGLTSAFWARIDYMLASAQAKGITIFLNAIGYDSDFNSGPGPLAGKSSTEFQAYGAALGARYASTPNLIWMVADDYFGGLDTSISAFLTGLRGAGDTHNITIENYPETTSRRDDSASSTLPWGNSNGDFNFTYTYNVTYYLLEKAYLESSPLPVLYGDGYFSQGNATYSGGTGAFAFDRASRQDAWHAASTGARGIIQGSEAIWQYGSSALSDSGTAWYYANNAGVIRSVIESYASWHKLVPDTSSALVTSGRGTHASGFSSGGGGGQYEVAFTDSYVTASRTPDGGSGSDLAVIYLSHATTIGIDQTKMVSGYKAWWVDPVTGTTYAGTPGSSYNSGAADGSKGITNSKGEADWVLILAAPQTVTVPGTATLSAAGSLTTGGTQGSGGPLGGAGSITGPLSALITGTTLAAAGSVATAVTQSAVASLAGTGSVTSSSADSAGTTLGGAGSLAAPASTLITKATLSGAGSLLTAAAQGAGATLAGTGSIAAAVAQGAVATLSGTGSVSASGAIAGAATLGGTGSVSTAAGGGSTLGGQGSIGPPATQGTTGTALSAAGSLSTTAAQGSPASLGAAGSLSTSITQAVAGTTLGGAGSVTGTTSQGSSLGGQGSIGPLAAQGAIATLAGTGSLGTAGTQQAGTTLAGAGSVAAPASAQQAGATLAGTGSVTSVVTEQAGTTLSGTGSLSGTAGQGAVLAGQGSISAGAAQGTTGTTLAGSGSLAAAAVQGAGTTLAGGGSVSTAATQGASAVLGGAGSVQGTAGQGSALSGTGSLAATATQQAGTTLAGGGSAITAATQGASAVLAAQGSVTAPSVIAPGAALGGAGSIAGSGSVTGSAGAALPGAGSLTAGVTQGTTGTALAGQGSVATSGTGQGAASLGGAGSITGPASIVLPGATLGGTGSLGTSVVQQAGTTLSGAGALATAAVLRASATLTGTGALAGSGAIAGAASLAGTGSVTGSGAVIGTTSATLTGTGSITAGGTIRAVAALAGTGTLTAGSTLISRGTTLPGTGSVTAEGNQHPPQVKGFSTGTSVTGTPGESSVTQPEENWPPSVTKVATSTSGVS